MQPIKVYCSFAANDRSSLTKLENHLSVLTRQSYIEIWHAGKALPGLDIEQERITRLNEADVILLLLSSDYMATDICYELEGKRAVQMQRANIAHVRIIPIRHVSYENTIFSECQALPINGKFVTDWQDKHKALHQIVEDIEKIVWEAQEDKNRREENRARFGYRLDKTHTLIDMPPLRKIKPPEPVKPNRQVMIQKPQSKRAITQAQKKKDGSRASTTKRRSTRAVAQSATVPRTFNYNYRNREISRKFSKNRGIYFVILFLVDIFALPLTIRSWIDSWILVGLVAVFSFLIFSWGTITTSYIIPIPLSLVFALAWGSLIQHLLPWPPSPGLLFIFIGVSIFVACVHYLLFRRR